MTIRKSLFNGFGIAEKGVALLQAFSSMEQFRQELADWPGVLQQPPHQDKTEGLAA
ncbi:hypothetical protein [Intestinimonas sp.]|uniref:hypothetical protein n=1 Tax=Intestinimonas sp. TaxID=1965293 RepID=UPI0026278971|nr:hypothetical protein [Intestinimonas sp.]